MYDSSIVPMSHSLKALAAILKKAEAYCEARKIDPNALLTARLFPDMLPLIRQVQIATRSCQGLWGQAGGNSRSQLSRMRKKPLPNCRRALPRLWISLAGSKSEQFAGAATRIVYDKDRRQGYGT